MTWDSTKETGRTVAESLWEGAEERGEPTAESSLQEQGVHGTDCRNKEGRAWGDQTPCPLQGLKGKSSNPKCKTSFQNVRD